MGFATSEIITSAELKLHLGKPNLVVIDCRFQLSDTEAGRNAFQASRIPGAVYAHLDDDLSGEPFTDKGRHPLPSPEQMRATFGRLGIDSQKQVVAYDDRNNMMAARLWWMLNYMGHANVAVLDGGWDAWKSAAGEIESTPPNQPDSVTFQGEPQADWLVTLEQVESQVRLIDSRAPERYRGEVEPIDPVGGHIGEAKNFHYANCLDDQGKFLSKEEIRKRLDESAFQDQSPEEVTFYCGSGVSACVNLIAARHAGFPMSKLYVGSWSEWSREKLG